MIDNTNLLNYSICFSELTSANWSNDEYNRMFISGIEKYINDLLEVKGFISWEKINNLLGVAANPDDVDRINVYRNNGKKLRLKLKQINPKHELPIYEISFKEE